MPRVQALAVVILLLSYGAVGARQPAVRASVPLPAPVAALAESFGLPVADRSRIVLDIIRLVFDTPANQDTKDAELRARLDALIRSAEPGETAPLPLDPAIWRETILRSDVPDARLLGSILSGRQTALLYHGLAALDDETLGWLGPERGVVQTLLEHAGAFAYSGRSLQVRAGRVMVPGGADAEPLWERLVGAPASRPASFVRQLFSNADGRLAYFYDAIAQLDPPRQRFALAADRPTRTRADHLRALSRAFERSFGELRIEERPFGRHPLDPALTLSTVRVSPAGQLVGPADKGLWEVVFRGDDALEPEFAIVESGLLSSRAGTGQVDAAWLAGRIHDGGMAVARRRLETFLFAQRVFRDAVVPDAAMATALRGMLAFPALMLTLERCGVTSPRMLADAAARAHALNAIGNSARRREALALFQSALGIIDRAATTGGMSRSSAAASIASLLALDLSSGDPAGEVATWLRRSLLPGMARQNMDAAESMESVVLAALAGPVSDAASQPSVEWEGRRYRVSLEAAELGRLRRIRERQMGPSLDDVLAGATLDRGNGDGDPRLGPLADVLISILYAAHIGDPESRLLAADNVALRHNLAFDGSGKTRPLAPWRFAVEAHGQASGWKLLGSLLGLDVPLSRFALRRLDMSTMPPPPRLTTNETQTAALTVVLMRPADLTDEVRDEIAAAVKRGRARLAALGKDPEEIARLARDAGISEWRREALAWTMKNEPGRVDSHLSLVELMWLGAPRPSAIGSLDRWGAAVFPLTGCLCLEMPRPAPWESLGGRPSVGLLATRGVDVTVLLAEEFSAMQLPAALVPAVLAFAMQDALDAAQPAYFDDWSEFGRAARTISRDRLIDYVAALASGGPLLPQGTDDRN